MTDGDGSTPPIHEVTLVHPDRPAVVVDVPADETVLQAARDAGIELQSGCEAGRCSTCTGRLLEGSFEYCRPPRALPEDKRDEGYMLLCSATPRGACRIEIGPHLREEALPGLWGSWD